MKRTMILAKALIYNSDGLVLLLKRHSMSKTRPGQWDFAGGKIDGGEDIAAGAIREIFEESGIKFGFSDLRLAWTESEIDGELTICHITFIANVPNADIRLSEEHSEYTWVTLDEAISMYGYPPHNRVLKLARDKQMIPNWC
jgi:8-oxo-dGTP pyrophosphatase MutT (NUDIX family)